MTSQIAGAGLICISMAGRNSLADLHFADRNRRRDVGVIGNVRHDLLGVRAEGGAERLDRIAIEMARSGKAGLGAGGAALDAVIDRDLLARRAELLLHHRHVLLAVIIDIELAALVARVKHAHLDHGFLPAVIVWQPGWSGAKSGNPAFRSAPC